MIMIVAMLIQASLQLLPSIVMIFRHYVYAKQTQKKAKYLMAYFLLGAAGAVALILTMSYMSIPDVPLTRWILAGVLIALAGASIWLYFRKGQQTELFLPRSMARNLVERVKGVSKRSDALILGLATSFLELAFSLPVYVVVAVKLNGFYSGVLRAELVLMNVLATMIPAILILMLYRSGKNLAEIQRTRVKNKKFYRILLSVCYLTLAVLVMGFGG